MLCYPAACPYGYQEHDGNCYIFQSSSATYDAALSGCESLGGVLAAPTSESGNSVFMHVTG